jgi:hypothetical protein
MKKALVGILLAGLVSFAAWAGPTVGIGAGWAENTVFVAPSFGVQWTPDGLGLASTMHLALAALITGTDFELALGGFWEILTVSYPIFDLRARSNCPPGDPCVADDRLRLIGGIGTPFDLASDSDQVDLTGFDLGLVFGLEIDNEYGSGVKLLGWYNGDTVGVGLTYRYDLLTPYR